MIGFGFLVIALGAFLTARPEAWWRLNEPKETQREGGPDDTYLRKTRMRGLTFILGGVALVIVQYFKG